jgi:hypothetical protein
MQTIQARYYAKGSRTRLRKWVVVHDMEIENKPDTAELIGHYFANVSASNKVSAHVGVDVNSAVRYVEDDDIAYAAPGANANGLHIELAGYAKFLNGDWERSDMLAMLGIAAPIVRDWCDRFGIPKTFVRAADLKRGVGGITTHYEVSQAFRLTNHTDPGPNFPIGNFVAAVVGPAPQTLKEASAVIGKQAVKILFTPSGQGYRIFGSDGGVFCYGDAQFFGSMGGQPLNQPITDAASTPTDRGYVLLGADGGTFAFGDAPFLGNAVEYLK